jgi:acetyl-CoA carboxylase carboxyl transferase subunit alpha
MANEDELRLRERLSKLGAMKLLRGTKLSGELARLQDQLDHLQADPSAEEIWQSVELARHVDRPYTLDYVERIFEDFFELHGDRGRADDTALVTGLGKLGDRTVVLVGHQKGRDLKERTKRNFGMAYPRATARRCVRWRSPTGTASHSSRWSTRRRVSRGRRRAARPGRRDRALAGGDGPPARPDRSRASSARGDRAAPVAIAVADRVLMQENAIYSVISPRVCGDPLA